MLFLPKKCIKQGLALLVLSQTFLLTPACAASQRRIMVLPFRNLSQQAADNWLSDSFSESLIMGMGQVRSLRLIERSEIQEVVKEQAFMQSVLADSSKAPRLGQLLSAEYIVVGNFQRVGERIQANVRLVNVETGEIEAHSLTQVKGSFDQLFELQTELAEKLVQRLQIDSPAQELRQIKSSIQLTQSTRAHEFYIRGLGLLAPLNSDKELTQALAWFQKAIAEDPGYALAYAGLAEIYAKRALSPGAYVSHQKNDADQAMIFAQKAFALKPDSADSYLALSYAHTALQQETEALEAAEQAALKDSDVRYVRRFIQLKYGAQMMLFDSVFAEIESELLRLGADPNDPLLLDLLATSYMMSVFRHPEKDHSAFMGKLDKAFAENPRLTQIGMFLAIMHKALGHTDTYQRLIQKAESANQDNPMALFLLAIMLSNMRSENEMSLRVLNRVVELQPDFAVAYQVRASIYQKLKDPLKARQDIELSLKYAPETPSILSYAAQFYLKANEPDQAKEFLIKAHQLNRDGSYNRVQEAEIDYYLGQVYRQKKRYQEALRYYRQAIDNPGVNQRMVRFYLQERASLYAEMEDYTQALKDMTQILQEHPDWDQAQWEYKAYFLQRALQKSPEDARLHNDLGQVYLQLGASDEALPHLLKARRLDVNNAVIAYNLGLAYQELKQWRQARQAFKASRQLDTRYTKAQFSLAQLDYQQGDVVVAESELRDILRESPDYVKALDLLAIIQVAQGHHQEAIRLLEKVLMLEPQHVRARRELERLKAL